MVVFSVLELLVPLDGWRVFRVSSGVSMIAKDL